MYILDFKMFRDLDNFSCGLSAASPEITNANKTLFSYKHHWSGQRQSVALRVSAHAVHQLDPGNKRILTTYNFKDIECLYEVTDIPGGFVIQSTGFGRLHMFQVRK